MNSTGRYLLRVLVAIDQLGNTLLGGRCDHTISGRIGINAIRGKKWALVCEKVVNAMFFWEDDHCRSAIEYDEVDKDLKDSY